MWLVILLGTLVVAALLRAWTMDRKAAQKGQRWMPVRQKGLRRTRFELVDKDTYDETLRERALEATMAERTRLRTEQQGYVTPRLPRRRRGRG